MTIKEEILKELRMGTPYAEVKKKFRSKSQIYEAIREYLPEAERKLDEIAELLRSTKEQQSKVNAELQKAYQEKENASREVGKLRQEKDALFTEVRGAVEKRNRICAEVKQLEEKGYSPTIMKKLGTVEATGPELLSSVNTAEQRSQLRKEVSGLETREHDLKGKIQTLETKRTNIEQSTVSEKNIFDELKLQTATYEKAMVAVDSLLKKGYSPEDIESLKHGLGMFGIRGRPVDSVTRLVRGLSGQKSIFAVEGNLERVTRELGEATEGLAAVKSELSMTKQATLKTIQESQQTSTKAIVDTRECSTQAIAETGKHAEDGIKRAMEKLEARANESMGKFDAQIQQAADRYKTELKQITELERRRAEVETVLGSGMPLVEMLKSDEALKKVPASSVVHIMKRIESWVEINVPEVKAIPTDEIWAGENFLLPTRTYKLSALIKLVSLGLKQHMIDQGRASAVNKQWELKR